MKQVTYRVRGLDCPNCAAKLERSLASLDGVGEVQLNYALETLHILCADGDPDALLPRLQACADHMEEGIVIQPEEQTDKQEENEEESPRKTLILLGAAAAAFLLSFALPQAYRPYCYLLCLLLSGGEVMLSSLRMLWRFVVSIFHPPLVNPLDESLLMTVAVIGACMLGEFAEGAMVMFLFSVGEQLQEAAVRRSRASIEKLMEVKPDHANLLTADGVRAVDPAEVVVGQRIELRPGERVPLDGIIEEGSGSLDTRDMTGESLPKDVSAGDEVLSGFINLNARLIVRVTRSAQSSAVSRTLARIRDAAKGRAQTELFFTRFARIYTPIVVGAAFLLAVIPWLLGLDAGVWVYRALNFLVISCPCALVLSIPLSFFCGIGGASKRGVLCKGGAALERLSRVRTAAFDKTGTLTTGRLQVSAVHPENGLSEDELLHIAASAEGVSSHPLARAIAQAGKGEDVQDAMELAGKGVQCLYREKPLLVGNQRLLEEEGIEAPALTHTGVLVALDGQYIGCIELSDTLHPDARRTIRNLREKGIERFVMLSGDNQVIADRIGLELGGMEVRAQLLPDEKVDALKSLGEGVVYVGDGVNDAPCLLAADVSAAIGLSGSEAAIEAADLVLLGDGPAGLVSALTIAKATMRNVRQNAAFALGIKGLFLVLSVVGWMPMWLAVFADAGVAVLCVLNSLRLLWQR